MSAWAALWLCADAHVFPTRTLNTPECWWTPQQQLFIHWDHRSVHAVTPRYQPRVAEQAARCLTFSLPPRDEEQTQDRLVWESLAPSVCIYLTSLGFNLKSVQKTTSSHSGAGFYIFFSLHQLSVMITLDFAKVIVSWQQMGQKKTTKKILIKVLNQPLAKSQASLLKCFDRPDAVFTTWMIMLANSCWTHKILTLKYWL